MAKFVIACPKCGRYTEASTGFFAKKKIDCLCGHTINVKTERFASKVCAHCGNTVVYDQSEGENATCPVCHEKLVTQQSLSALAEFTCPSCGCKLSADKSAARYTCPLCDTHIDVQQRIAKEQVKNQGLASIIKYEGGNDTFVWKHPIEDFNLGSQLIVHESQEALFFRDGQALDLFGPGRYALATQNIPLLENICKLPANSDAVFHSEVYFINLTTQMGIKWGTDSKVRLFDPASGLYIEIGASGNFSLRVNDSRKLLVKLVGTTNTLTHNDIIGSQYSISSVVGKFRALVMNKVKANLARTIKENEINILEIDAYIDTISNQLRTIINETLDEYGLTMPEFFVTTIVTPDDDPSFRRLKQQFADKTLRVREEELRKAEAEAAYGRKMIEAQTEAQLKTVSAKAEADALLIKAQAEAEAYKAQAMAEAAEMHAKGYTYQQETSRLVGLEALQGGIMGGGNNGGGMTGAAGGMLGDIASLGITLGAVGSVINMTKDSLNPLVDATSKIGQSVGSIATPTTGWDCACGQKNIPGNFCGNCGAKRPESTAPAVGWDCACGQKGITGNFCGNCGAKRPAPATWDCACGKTGITGNFCENCGSKRGE